MIETVPGRKLILPLCARLLWAAALLLPVFVARGAVVFTSLHSFQVSPNGANPQSALVQGSDGNFYGTTVNGGANNYGTVFKITTNGALNSLYSFRSSDGANPQDGLVQGSDGNLYGTTSSGGGHNRGTVFQVTTNGALTSLYSFAGGNDGNDPRAALVEGRDGNFYGTTLGGGTNGGFGTVFRITTDGALASLYSFTGGNDGREPYAGLVQGSDGNFYGTTAYGGGNNYGTVFQISTNGALTTLYSFSFGDGAYPQANLVQGSDGNFYGATVRGGTSFDGLGTVFQISTNGALTTLYSFTGGNDGGDPYGGLVQGSDGNFYGTTEFEGANYRGTVFKISTNGALTSLYSFSGGNDGANPFAGLVLASDGSFYGTTSNDGTQPGYNGAGTVFKISANRVLSTLYTFTSGADGAYPQAGLVQGSDGNFYGTTESGGKNGGDGTVFNISTNGALTSLYSFGKITNASGVPFDGANPSAGLVQGSDGNFYGTSGGGSANYGTVFKISTNGALTTLHTFTGGNEGGNPSAGLVQGSDGNFYGTTQFAGVYYSGSLGFGTVYKISAHGVLTILHLFSGGDDGAYPQAGLVQGGDGSFYGTTANGGVQLGYNGNGTVFNISPSGMLTTLYTFGTVTDTNGEALDGASPIAGLAKGSDGNFYGTTELGGMDPGPSGSGLGTVFQISTNGTLTTLHSFTGGNDGRYPYAGLVQGSDGNFYGTTESGGTNYYGTIFKITTDGALTTLYVFTGGNDGANPNAGLVQGSDGSFYGTTYAGGQGGVGTVFRLAVVSATPTLSLSMTPTGTGAVLSWPTNAAGFVVQSTSNLTPPITWADTTNLPVILNGQYTLTNTASASVQFFRLKD